MAVGLHTNINPPALPTELWQLIVSYLNRRTMKRLRIVNKLMHLITTPLIFRIVRFDLTEELTIKNLIQIASHEQLRKCVRRLVLCKRHGLREFVGVFHWERHFCFPDAIGQGQGTTSGFDKDAVYDDKDDEDEEMMSISEWNDLNQDEKRKIYEEYEAGRRNIEAQTHAMVRHWYEQVCEHPDRWVKNSEEVMDMKVASGTKISIGIEEFDTAILALENLEEFFHRPMGDNLTWGHRWWRLRFDLRNFSRWEEDQNFESLQLAVSLAALGKNNSIGHNIYSLKLYMPGKAFWAPDRITSRFRNPENSRIDFADEHQQLPEYSVPERDCLCTYNERLSTAKLSFRYLTHLECMLNPITDIHPHEPEVLTGFYELVQQTSNTLEHLTITMDDSGIIYPTKAYSKEVCDNEFLTRLPTTCEPWKKLARVELEVFTDVTSIMTFLTFVAATLQELKLSRVRIPDCGGTLRELVTQIGQNLHQLRVLELYKSGFPPFVWTETITFDRKVE